MATGKVIFGIIERRIEALRVGAAGPAYAARKDAAAVNTEAEVVVGYRAAGAARTAPAGRPCGRA